MRLPIIILSLALLAASASAAFGCNVPTLISTCKGSIIDQDNLKYIVQSQYNQYEVVVAFFAQGDLDGNGQLTLVEFSKAYSSFIYFLLGQQISSEYLYARWELADFTFNTNTIDLAEFTFIVTMDLKFIYKNYNLFNGNLDTLSASVAKVESLVGGESFSDIFGSCFFGFDFDKDSQLSPKEFRKGFKMLGYILGLNLSYTGPLLNDFFSLADANGDMEVSYAEGYGFISSHLAAIKVFLSSVAAGNWWICVWNNRNN